MDESQKHRMEWGLKKKARYKNNAAELPFMQNWQNV